MNGYKANSKNYTKSGDIYKSVFAYNHADNYVMAVLELTEKIRERATGIKSQVVDYGVEYKNFKDALQKLGVISGQRNLYLEQEIIFYADFKLRY